MGPETIAFEEELAVAVGAPHVVTVNSCTSALFLSLLVAGIGPGDEVICPSLTWCSTANAALFVGATPVFCDIDPTTLCLTPELVRAKLTSRTKAVVVVHFGGLAVDVEELKLALPDGIDIIEDAAHAFGSKYPDGTTVGRSRCLTCFSFYANKNLSTAEGGAIALLDAATADRLRSLRQHALPLNAWKRFSQAQALLLSNELTHLGYKMNYTDLQAALGRVQLARQTEFGKLRLKIARLYVERLQAVKPALQFQDYCVHPNHARHLFVVQLPLSAMKWTRNEVVLALRQANIGASIHYSPLHTMSLYRGANPEPVLPATEQVAQRIMTLPISASMTVDDAEDVASALASVLRAAAA